MAQVSRPYKQNEAVAMVLDEIQERVRHSGAAPVFVGVSGIDCSGKSTFASTLKKAMAREGFDVALVNVDDFIIPGVLRKFDGPPDIDYFENTFDHVAFIEAVLRAGDEARVVLAEGVLIFRQELVERWDLKVWMEMPESLSLERGAVRDADYFGSAENARAEYLRRFIPAHRHHLERDQPAAAADFVFTVD